MPRPWITVKKPMHEINNARQLPSGSPRLKQEEGTQQPVVNHVPGALHHFVFSPISSPLVAGTPVTGIAFTAQDSTAKGVGQQLARFAERGGGDHRVERLLRPAHVVAQATIN